MFFFSSLTGDVELNPGPVTAESMTTGKEMSFVEADFVLTQNAQAYMKTLRCWWRR